MLDLPFYFQYLTQCNSIVGLKKYIVRGSVNNYVSGSQTFHLRTQWAFILY